MQVDEFEAALNGGKEGRDDFFDGGEEEDPFADPFFKVCTSCSGAGTRAVAGMMLTAGLRVC